LIDEGIQWIYLSIDYQQLDEETRGERPYTDVIVKLRNGDFFLAPFFSYNSIFRLRSQYEESGEYLGGQYFWVEGMILIKDLDHETVWSVVENLIEEGDFLNAFKKL
jgi:hypothetical protein